MYIPPVEKLKNNSIEVIRWLQKEGKKTVRIGPHESNWIPIHRMSLHTIHAILVAEDARFYDHSGLDLQEIKESFFLNLQEKKFVRGGSTLTQQVVKLAFLDSQKNYLRKLKEAIGALRLEMILTKDEIMEWYLNLVNFGNGVYGIDGGAYYYFNTSVELLNIPQSILLAMVLPSPNIRAKSLTGKRLTPSGKKRYVQLATEMFNNHFITREQYEHALHTGNFGAPVVEEVVE